MEEKPNSSQDAPKGFGGLSSMASNVSSIHQPVPAQSPRPTEEEAPQRSVAPGASPSVWKDTSSSPTGNKRRWIIIVACVLAAVIGFIAINDRTSTPSSQRTSQEASRPIEVTPPVGRDQSLSVAQIRYCLAEKIRLTAGDAVLNASPSLPVTRFNLAVEDYNSRCASYRYRRRDMTSATSDIEPYRAVIEAEGRRRFSQ